jgi:hypothetical protein
MERRGRAICRHGRAMNRAGDRQELREGESYCADASPAGLTAGGEG